MTTEASTKTARLELRLTETEKDLFERAAAQDGRPLSNWTRDRLMKAARSELGEDGSGSAIQARGKDSRSNPRTKR